MLELEHPVWLPPPSRRPCQRNNCMLRFIFFGHTEGMTVLLEVTIRQKLKQVSLCFTARQNQ